MSHKLHELHKFRKRRLPVEGDIIRIMDTTRDIHSAGEGVVVSNPNILGGTPVFAGTRVPVKTLFEYLADNLTVAYFLESFPTVTRQQVETVLRYSQSQLERELAA